MKVNDPTLNNKTEIVSFKSRSEMITNHKNKLFLIHLIH